MKRQTLLATALAMALAAPAAVQAAPEASFGGQYRINSYYLDVGAEPGLTNESTTAAARVRIRQNIDLKFSEKFDTHLQFNIGHIRDGVFNHNLNHNGNASFGIRHAVMSYHFSPGLNLIAGIVPLNDHFDATLFNADWDFNPITVALAGDIGGAMYRLAWFKVSEGATEQASGAAGVDIIDDIDAYILDVDTKAGDVDLGVMGLLITAPDQSTVVLPAAATDSTTNYWIGGHAGGAFGGVGVNASVVYSNVDRNTIGTLDDATGVQLRLSADAKVGDVDVGLMGLWTQGSTDANGDGTGFGAPMTLVGSQGYWGRTGLLTVQGPTDTGMDQFALRTDNDGYGLWTIQGNAGTSFTDEISGYVAVAYFRANKERVTGQGKSIGTDVYAQVKYAFPDSPLALEVGGAYATTGKAFDSSYGGTSGDRDIWAAFSRLQAEF